MSKRRSVSSLASLFAALGLVAYAQPAAAAIIPSARVTLWNPGIPGGIPDVTTIYTTINPTLFGNGITDAAPAINTAIQLAGDVAASTGIRQVVYLPPGAYRLTSGPIDLNRSNVVLRGAGAGLTKIFLDWSQLTPAIRMGFFWPSYVAADVVDVVGSVPKGAMSITVTNATAIQVGDVLQIDQEDDTSYVVIGDGTYFKRGPGSDPPAANWRSVGQQIEVASKNGNVLGLSGPIHIAFNAAFKPQVFPTAGGQWKRTYIGLEDLYVNGGNNGNINLLDVAYCWIKNVESDGNPLGFGHKGMDGGSIAFDAAYRCELRGSYVHHARSINPGGGAYGIVVRSQSSDNLIEDNIAYMLDKPIVLVASGGGNVVGYNYSDQAIIDYQLGWQENTIDGGHNAFPHFELIEGNWSPTIGGDTTHGNTGWLTFFRNFARGRNGDDVAYQNVQAANATGFSVFYNFVGNVLLYPGVPPLQTYPAIYESSWNGTTEVGNLFAAAAFRIGNSAYPTGPEWDNGEALSTLYRHGNFDYVTNSVIWDPTNADHNLPNSLYLTSKPAFFGNYPWPWVDPLGPTKVGTLPAKARFDSGAPILGKVHFSAASYSVPEGGTATVTVRRDPPTSSTVHVDYATSDGTATADVGPTKHDYVPQGGPLTFAVGQTSLTLTVPTNINTVADGSRSFLLRLTNATGGAVLGDQSTAVVTIVDNDKAGAIGFTASAYSANEGNAYAIVRITRTGGGASGAVVDFTASGGTAVANVDYTPVFAKPIVFAAGQLSQDVTVQLFEDVAVEANKTVSLSLSAPSGGAVLARSTAVLTIIADNPVLQFSAANFSTLEPVGRAVITVKRSGPTGDPLSVHFATAPGTAAPGIDYLNVSGDITFPAKVTTKTFNVPLVNDAASEPNRTVMLSLSNPQNLANPSQIALGQQFTAVLTIKDTDSTPRLQFGAPAYAVAESAGTAKIIVRRFLGTGSRATVDYHTSNGTAQTPANYDSAAGTLTFLPGEVMKTVPVTVHKSTTPVGDLTVNLALTNPRGDIDNPQGIAVLGNPNAAVLTIRSDDPLLQFSAPTYKIGETGPQATITVKRSGPPNVQVAVQYDDAPGGTALPGVNYSLGLGTLTFDPGVLTRTFTVAVMDDGMVHPDKTVNLVLSNPTNGAALGAQKTAVLTLVTDDPRVQFTSPAYSIAESAPKATITVKRTGPTGPVFTVPVSATNGTATSANYGPPNPLTLEFGKGVMSRSFSIPIVNDFFDEPPPLTVNLALGAPVGALLGSPQTAVLTIADNDVAGTVQFSVSDYSVSEAGGKALVTVVRTGGLAGGVTVHYATSSGSATLGTNYAAASGTLTFDNGQTSQAFTIDVLDDGASGNKTVNLALSSPAGGAILGPRSTATLWIVNTD